MAKVRIIEAELGDDELTKLFDLLLTQPARNGNGVVHPPQALPAPKSLKFGKKLGRPPKERKMEVVGPNAGIPERLGVYFNNNGPKRLDAVCRHLSDVPQEAVESILAKDPRFARYGALWGLTKEAEESKS